MKKAFLIIFAAAFILAGCNKATEQRYNSHDNIYLDLGGGERDSILYTFAYEPTRLIDTLYIPVRISGIRQNVARKFILRVMADSSTAQVGEHYKALDEYYTIPANKGDTNVPIIIYNKDPNLESKSVMLRFKLVGTSDFDINTPTLIAGKLVFSNKLEKPGWWGDWFGDYYSRAKHQFFLFITGLTSLTTGTQGGLDAPKNLYFVSLVDAFINDPAKWISKNPTKGYVLAPRSDGDFDFYNTATPSKIILYHKNVAKGKYLFIDENGNEVE